MTLNAQIYNTFTRPTTFFEDLPLPETSGHFRSMDPFHFFENNLMREILLDSNESDDHETTTASYTRSAVSRPRLPYAKFSASSLEDAARFMTTATRPTSHDVSDNDEQTPQVAAPAPAVVDMRARRPPGHLTVVVSRPVNATFATGHQRVPNRQKLTLKRHMDRVLGAQYDERNENCMLSVRLRSLNSSNFVEFIMEP